MVALRGEAPPPVAERPVCAGCGEPRKPEFWHIWEWDQDLQREVPIAKRWRGQYQGYGHFCTLRCATNYANRLIDSHDRRRQ